MYDIFEQLCKHRGLSVYQVSKDTEISRTTFTDWKKGKSIPKVDKLLKIANYFDVSIEYLMTGVSSEKNSEEGNSYYFNDATAKIAQEIYENKELRGLFDAARDASPEDLETVQTMLLALKRKEKGE